MASTNAPAGRHNLRRVIVASSAGTLIEWYDFFIYGSLAVFFSGFFFPPQDARLGLLVSIAAFGTGFVVRPLGAVLFGRLGDRYGCPLRDTFADRRSVLLIGVVLFGLTGGLGVVWYTSQFYALYFLQSVLKVDFTVANVCIAVAALLSTPMYVVFGALSDRHGRMTFVIAGLSLSAIGYVPLYSWMQHAAATGGHAQIVLAVFLQMTFAAMVYGPTAALLTELFPPQIRYTGLSVAYHLGTGVFGGFTPLVALASTSSTGNPLSGLTYSITSAALTALVGVVFLRRDAATPLVRRAWERFADPTPDPEPDVASRILR